jgi:hypothetical protein
LTLLCKAEIEVELVDEVAGIFRREALRQNRSVSDLVAHAVFLYLAEREALSRRL